MKSYWKFWWEIEEHYNRLSNAKHQSWRQCVYFLHFNNFNTKTPLKWPHIYNKIRNYIDRTKSVSKLKKHKLFIVPLVAQELIAGLNSFIPSFEVKKKKHFSAFIEKPYIELSHCFYFYNSQSTDNLSLIFIPL